MKVIFVDEYNSSRFNGIGTYRDILLPLLSKEKNIQIILISLNSFTENLIFNKRTFGKEFALPFVAGGKWRDNGYIIWSLLRQYIDDSSENIFIFNHSPAADNILAMKEMFPLSHVVFVIHDQGWCAPLFGDSNLLKMVENGVHHEMISEQTWNYVRDYCDKERAIYDIADAVVCLSESTESYLESIYKLPKTKIVRIFNGYPDREEHRKSKSDIRKGLGLLPEEQILMFVARAVPHKGIIPLMKAIEIVAKDFPRVRCAITGAPEQIVKYWEIGKKCAPNLILPGQLNSDELRDWYAAADIGVLSSFTEQCSYAALEMMASGLLIVSSDGNGLRDMFKDRENALVAHIESVTDIDGYSSTLASRIKYALNLDLPTKLNLIASSKKLLREKYSEKVMVSSYVKLFHRLSSGKNIK